jgi:hypothetical protein
MSNGIMLSNICVAQIMGLPAMGGGGGEGWGREA